MVMSRRVSTISSADSLVLTILTSLTSVDVWSTSMHHQLQASINGKLVRVIRLFLFSLDILSFRTIRVIGLNLRTIATNLIHKPQCFN